MHPNFLRTDVFASAVISYGYANKEETRKAILRYLLCFGKRNANLTHIEREAQHQPEPFVEDFEEHRYWRSSVESSQLYYAVKKKFVIDLKDERIITNPYPESIYKAIKVLVKGSVPHIAGRFFRGAKIITMPRSEFKKEQSALPGQRILYCLQDDESDTEIVMLGTWRSGYFVPESQSLSTTRTGKDRLQVYLSDRGLLPDYIRLTDLAVNLFYHQNTDYPYPRICYRLEGLFNIINPGKARLLVKKDWGKFEQEMLDAEKAWQGINVTLKKTNAEQIGESADLYRQLILLMVEQFQPSPFMKDVIWPLMQKAVRPYLELRLLDRKDRRDLHALVGSLNQLLRGQRKQTPASTALLTGVLNQIKAYNFPKIMVQSFLYEGVSASSLLAVEDDCLGRKLADCVTNIRDLLQEMVFKQWAVAYERTAEIMLLYLDVQKTKVANEDYLQRMVRSMAPEGLKMQAKSFPYAMNAIYHIVSNVLKEQPEHAQLFCLGSVYFEMLNQLRSSKSKFLEVARLQDISVVPDVLIADMHTNNALSDFLRPNDVCSWLLGQLETDESDRPVHLILDLTLNNPSERLVREWVARLSANPRVNVYIIMSLTKLMQMGVDILSMGVCFISGENAVKLDQITLNEPKRKQEMFNFLSSAKCEALREKFFSKIHENVNYLYRELNTSLLPEKKGGLVSVGFSQDDRSVYVALKFDKLVNLQHSAIDEDTLQELLLECQSASQVLRIPLSGRNSFGFSFSAINQVKEALRLTGGVEPQRTVDRMVKFLATFCDLLSIELKDEGFDFHDFYANFDNAVKAVATDYPHVLLEQKPVKVMCHETGECHEYIARIELTDQGIRVSGQPNAVFLNGQPLLYFVYWVFATDQLELVDDYGHLVYMNDKSDRPCFLFGAKKEIYRQTTGQSIVMTVQERKSSLIDWCLDDVALSDIQIYVRMPEQAITSTHHDTLPVRYDRLSEEERISIFNHAMEKEVVLEELPAGNTYLLKFAAIRPSLFASVENYDDYDAFKVFLSMTSDESPVRGLESSVFTHRYQLLLCKKAISYVKSSDDAEVAALAEDSAQKVLLAAHLAYRMKRERSLSGLLDQVGGIVDRGWFSAIDGGELYKRQVLGIFQHRTYRYASALTIGDMDTINSLGNPEIKRTAINTLNDFVYDEIKNDVAHSWEVDAFKQLPIVDSEWMVRALESQGKVHDSYHKLISFWINGIAPNLMGLLDIRYFDESWFWRLKSFSKSNGTCLTGYWQNLADKFISQLRGKSELSMNLFNQGIFWYLHIGEVLSEKAEKLEFQQQLCAILRGFIDGAKFPKDQLELWLDTFYVYDEYPDYIDPQFLFLENHRRSELRHFMEQTGMWTYLSTSESSDDIKRVKGFCESNEGDSPAVSLGAELTHFEGQNFTNGILSQNTTGDLAGLYTSVSDTSPNVSDLNAVFDPKAKTDAVLSLGESKVMGHGS